MLSDLPICLSQVSVHVKHHALLHGINLELTSGPPTVLVGPNGSGKTTLLRVAMGLLTPTGGRITWNGQEIAKPVRRAFMFQRPVMLRRTVCANICYALAAAGVRRSKRDERANELLASVGLEGLADRPARHLSGGERQRLSLARALAKNPTVLFLDEPTASLDPAATQSIEQLLLAASERGVKVVMSTHDLHEARRLAGDVVLLHRGIIIEVDRAAKFFTEPSTELARRFLAGDLLL
jgi:tungstate transport system ATP-binding protein